MVGLSVQQAMQFGITPQMAAQFGVNVGQQAPRSPFGKPASYSMNATWAARNNVEYKGPPLPAPTAQPQGQPGAQPGPRQNLPAGMQVKVFADGQAYNPAQSLPAYSGGKLAPTYGKGYDTRTSYLNGGIQSGYSFGAETRGFNKQLQLQNSLEQQGVLSSINTAGSIFKIANNNVLSGAIDKIGGSAFPTIFNPGATLPPGVHGPVQPAGLISGTGTTLSGAIGGAGIGYTIGNVYAGLTGAKPVGSSVGGTIGGIAGSFLPIPGGTIIGSVIGSAIGGLFGGSNPTSASESLTIIGAAGEIRHTSIGTKRADAKYAEAVQGEVVNFTGSLGQLGVRFLEGRGLRAGYNKNQGGGFVEYEDQSGRYNYDINDQGAASSNLAKLVVGAVNVDAIENEGLREGLRNYSVGNKTMAQVYEDIRNMAGPQTNKAGEPLDPRPLDVAAKDRIKRKTQTAKQQMDEFLKEVKEGTVGKAELITTSPLGILEDIPGIKRKLSSGTPLGSFGIDEDNADNNILGV